MPKIKKKASGKTLVAELALTNNIKKGKAIYIVPLKALANEIKKAGVAAQVKQLLIKG